jgi:tRNA U34 5-carboxymethylaminomethyl modifying GTPase MnmE/TrmE
VPTSQNPIKKPDEDMLGRKALKEDVTKLVLENSDRESFTVGIIGKWSAGKSTVLNFLLLLNCNACVSNMPSLSRLCCGNYRCRISPIKYYI